MSVMVSHYATSINLSSTSIQPAGKAHVVYTPLHTVTVGSHYVNWMGLPRMELFRSFEKLTDRAATNHDHCYVQLMLIYMAASLPARVKEGGVFFKKPLIALCLMVLWPRKYIHPGSIEERVQLVCIAVLKRLVPDQFASEPAHGGSRAIVDLPDMSVIRRSYLFESLKDQDPGPEVDIGSCLEKYVGWTPPADDLVLALKGRATASFPRRQAQPLSAPPRTVAPEYGIRSSQRIFSQLASRIEVCTANEDDTDDAPRQSRTSESSRTGGKEPVRAEPRRRKGRQAEEISTVGRRRPRRKTHSA
ncbi:hypothetical protein BD626DRAFT_572389 [Schizophyllum amplum]|uniref:Uncharacterized protein n=1 Tax=Schizophyllum amplum TaxID=97359 RepID=A0A550C4H8_9AGAR|nr:hypothetical protein BD626DRAFT_572389 [Auriculariopsis ampla]